MPLTHFDIRNTKPADKPFKLSDGGGLFLRVQPNGSMLWRLEYRFVGKERALSFGADPTVSLADARRKRDEAKKLLDKGKDPSSEKRTERLARKSAARNTFGLIAEEYIENLKGNGMAEITVEKNRWLLQDLARPPRTVPSRRSRRPSFSICSSGSKRAAGARPRAGCAASWVRSFDWQSSPSAPQPIRPSH